MSDLPVMLHVRGRRVVIAGGGSVALRRAQALLDAGADVAVIAPAIDEQLAAMDVTIQRRPFQVDDLEGAMLVVIATDDAVVNEAAAEAAGERGVLVNRADDPPAGDLVIPAHGRIGPVTVAVHTGGISPPAGAAIRDELIESLDGDWVTLLKTAEPYRRHLQQTVQDPTARHTALQQLTDKKAMLALKRGGASALDEHCRDVIEQAADTETGGQSN